VGDASRSSILPNCVLRRYVVVFDSDADRKQTRTPEDAGFLRIRSVLRDHAAVYVEAVMRLCGLVGQQDHGRSRRAVGLMAIEEDSFIVTGESRVRKSVQWCRCRMRQYSDGRKRVERGRSQIFPRGRVQLRK
jgi:hypothetical protein